MKLATEAMGSVLRDGPFRRFFGAFMLSGIGDAMAKTALVWYVLEATNSAPAVGALLLAYAGPVSIGGVLAGYLLDRFDRRRVMVVDNVLRGLVMASIPIAAATGNLILWHVYVVAALYGLLFMISLAGTPALIPSLVTKDQFNAANSLETLGFTVSGVAGPAVAGVLIAGIGSPYVLALDSLSYFIFALVLARLPLRREPVSAVTPATLPPYRLADAVRLLFGNSVLLSLASMFMAFNAGGGLVAVWLPVHADALAAGNGAELYGLFLAVLAAGQAIGALGAGSVSWPLPEGRMICIAQTLAGLGLGLALVGGGVWSTALALLLLGLFSGPLTVWAQTLRMRIIPPELHGRSFALTRMLIQASAPAFSGIGGVLLPVVGVTAMVAMSVGLIAAPGVVATRVRSLVAPTSGGQPAVPPRVPADRSR